MLNIVQYPAACLPKFSAVTHAPAQYTYFYLQVTDSLPVLLASPVSGFEPQFQFRNGAFCMVHQLQLTIGVSLLSVNLPLRRFMTMNGRVLPSPCRPVSKHVVANSALMIPQKLVTMVDSLQEHYVGHYPLYEYILYARRFGS
jgi:hypothetical protein